MPQKRNLKACSEGRRVDLQLGSARRGRLIELVDHAGKHVTIEDLNRSGQSQRGLGDQAGATGAAMGLQNMVEIGDSTPGAPPSLVIDPELHGAGK